MTLRQLFAPSPFVVVGAAAVSAWLEMTWRRTHDVDLVVLTDAQQAARDLQALGFAQHPRLEHRWVAPSGLPADILPVTEGQLRVGKLVWPQSRNEMSLTGVELALRHNVEVSVGRGQSVHVATLPCLVIAKMAAWLERPDERLRDLEDLGQILTSYLAIDDMRRWNDESLRVVEFDDQGAHVLGKDLAEITKPVHRKLVETFLRECGSRPSAIDQMARGLPLSTRDPHETIEARLRLMHQGLSAAKTRRRGRSH